MFADVTLPPCRCDHRKPSRKDAGGLGGKRGQVWDDYRVSIHVINAVIFAQDFILIQWVSRLLFCPQQWWGGCAIGTRNLCFRWVVGVFYPAPPTGNGARRCNRSGRCPLALLPCVGGGVNLSRTTLQTACYDDDPHLPSLAYVDPLIMRHGAMLLVVFGGNVPSTWFSSSRHDPTHDPACVAKAPEYYFYRPHEPSCTQIVM